MWPHVTQVMPPAIDLLPGLCVDLLLRDRIFKVCKPDTLQTASGNFVKFTTYVQLEKRKLTTL